MWERFDQNREVNSTGRLRVAGGCKYKRLTRQPPSGLFSTLKALCASLNDVGLPLGTRGLEVILRITPAFPARFHFELWVCLGLLPALSSGRSLSGHELLLRSVLHCQFFLAHLLTGSQLLPPVVFPTGSQWHLPSLAHSPLIGFSLGNSDLGISLCLPTPFCSKSWQAKLGHRDQEEGLRTEGDPGSLCLHLFFPPGSGLFEELYPHNVMLTFTR